METKANRGTGETSFADATRFELRNFAASQMEGHCRTCTTRIKAAGFYVKVVRKALAAGYRVEEGGRIVTAYSRSTMIDKLKGTSIASMYTYCGYMVAAGLMEVGKDKQVTLIVPEGFVPEWVYVDYSQLGRGAAKPGGSPEASPAADGYTATVESVASELRARLGGEGGL